MMLVDGYTIKTALKQAKDRREMAADQFTNSLWVFEDAAEDSPTPEDVVAAYRKADEDFAMIQVVQQWYNLQVDVLAGPFKMKLALAVKLIGGTGRREQFWRKAIKELRGERDRWSESRKLTRSKDEEHAQPQVTYAQAVEEALCASKEVSELRVAVGQGNAMKLELPDHLTWPDPRPDHSLADEPSHYATEEEAGQPEQTDQ